MSIAAIRKEFSKQFALVDHALSQFDDASFIAEPGGGANSATVQIAHLSAAFKARFDGFLTQDHEKPWRDRAKEFAARDGVETVKAAWEEAKAVTLRELEALTDSDLKGEIRFKGQTFPAEETLLSLLTHVAYHAAQVVLIGRQALGSGWTSLAPSAPAKP
jgi:uncharacterized damage-inducible protein DinB